MICDLGVDFSSPDGPIDWAVAASRGIRFATLRASWGLTGGDPAFVANRALAIAACIEPIAYHWFVPRQNAITQAINFATICQQNGGCSPIMLDLEDTQSVKAYRGIAVELRKFLNEVKRLTGETCLIYVNRYYAASYLGESWWAEYPLVVASWDAAAPTMPKPWQPGMWYAWQTTGKADARYYGFTQSRDAALYVRSVQ